MLLCSVSMLKALERADVCHRSFFLVGTITTSAIVQIPERLQIISGFNPFDAGVRSLPFIATVPFFSLVCGILTARYKIRHVWVLLGGTAFQIIGVVLFAFAHTTQVDAKADYGYQILLAVGLGINNMVLTNTVPFMVEKRLIRK